MTTSSLSHSNPRICILDYGSGNVRSVFNMIKKITSEVVVSNQEKDILDATHLILPGVGAFAAAMEKVEDKLPIALLRKLVCEQGKPFLGICIGMHILAEDSDEGGEASGLAWLPTRVEKVPAGNLALPHIGWNEVFFSTESWFFPTFNQPEDFYFIHSYAMNDNAYSSMSAEYGQAFCVGVEKGNMVGIQFHPEKSQTAGLLFLSRFFEMEQTC